MHFLSHVLSKYCLRGEQEEPGVLQNLLGGGTRAGFPLAGPSGYPGGKALPGPAPKQAAACTSTGPPSCAHSPHMQKPAVFGEVTKLIKSTPGWTAFS